MLFIQNCKFSKSSSLKTKKMIKMDAKAVALFLICGNRKFYLRDFSFCDLLFDLKLALGFQTIDCLRCYDCSGSCSNPVPVQCRMDQYYCSITTGTTGITQAACKDRCLPDSKTSCCTSDLCNFPAKKSNWSKCRTKLRSSKENLAPIIKTHWNVTNATIVLYRRKKLKPATTSKMFATWVHWPRSDTL